jgi:signal transduction histidine kinase
MSNAVKFTEKGTVELKVVKKADLLKIAVSDTGIGMKKEDIPKLFNSFIRLDSPMKEVIPGTGLGLYLTKKIMTGVFQGDISVESDYGKGSTFTLDIPLKRE